jgi:membrane-associated protease RseP (regulator of RpoE activity)
VIEKMDYQTIAAILFILGMTYFLFKNKEKVSFQKIAFPVLYFVMYRTKIGINFMEGTAKKFPRLLKWLAYAGVAIGFLGMAFITYSLVYNLARIIITPATTAGVALVLPFKVKGSFYVPFFYWIISIFVLAVIHEFSHGIISRVYGVKIKSSGFAFLGVLVPILPAAFVEPDEKQMRKKSTAARLSVFAAGPFSNIVFAALVAVLFMLVFTPLAGAIFEPAGIEVAGYVKGDDNTTYPAEEANISMGEIILKINNAPVLSIENFTDALNNTKPGDKINIVTNVSSYTVTLAENPEAANKSYLGVFVKQELEINDEFKGKYGNYATGALIWIIGLFYWFYVLNLGIGLFNLVPIGPLDGGRMLHVVLTKYLREDIALKVWKLIGTLFLFIIVASIAFAFIK